MSIDNEIIKLGKVLRNRVYFDIYEPLDYGKVFPLLARKELEQKKFLQNNLYKKINDESTGIF